MIARSNAPAGVYEAKIASLNIRIGWAVSKGGARLGVENDEGIEVPAPPPNLKDGSFKLNGRIYHATVKKPPEISDAAGQVPTPREPRIGGFVPGNVRLERIKSQRTAERH